MNTGINFNEDITNLVILGTPSSVDLRQSIARVRKGEHKRSVRLYIHVPHGNSFNAKLKRLRKELQFLSIGNDEWKKKYGRNTVPSFVFYDDKKGSTKAERKVNQLKLAKIKSDEQYFGLIASDPEKAYMDFISKYYPDLHINWLRESTIFEENLLEVLVDLKGKILLKEGQENLKRLFKINGIHSRKGTIGLNVINQWWLEENTSFI